MFVPLISKRSPSLARRKGGGKSGGGKSSSGKSSSGSGSASSKGKSSSVSTSTGSRTATTYGGGGGKATTIGSGQSFAGRTEGGGTRGQVYGTWQYGSGYPSLSGSSVTGRGFPFYYWPIVWDESSSHEPDLNTTAEYGSPNNASRPGGPLMAASFQSNSTGTIFRILADNETVAALADVIRSNCSSYMGPNQPPNNGTAFSAGDSPFPEQVVQYYRASSASLSIDDYNTTGLNTTTIPALPAGVDMTLLMCLNYTIGAAIPLISYTTKNRHIADIVIGSVVFGLAVIVGLLKVCCDG
ncbi:hypothetical protein C8R45DRAFT_861092 [Mycena sanguinolenta]|nr:hypothetical protein C8R45DRAFT_861092 [Mycena sanguinolenta]